MRSYLVTGSASGIGKATVELLRQRGATVWGADLHDADIEVDLTSADGRERLVSETERLSGGKLDGIIAVAGLAQPVPATVGVNYFGMVATLEGLRPLLAGSAAPRAVGVASEATLLPVDEQLVELQLSGDEPAALARAEELSRRVEGQNLIYSSSKVAFARWIRRKAVSDEWSGAGIPLNAIAPGLILTPMVEPLLATEEGRQMIAQSTPMPLNGPAPALTPAYLLAWLTSEENTHLCGQVIFIDGGSDVVFRGDRVW